MSSDGRPAAVLYAEPFQYVSGEHSGITTASLKAALAWCPVYTFLDGTLLFDVQQPRLAQALGIVPVLWAFTLHPV